MSRSEFILNGIDPSAILIMTEEKLIELLPKLGDRLAVIDFCKKQLIPKKQSLIERLKHKIDEKNKKSIAVSTSNKPCTTKKRTRVVEVGWMYCTEGDKYTQIRKLQGGGARQIHIDRSGTVKQVEEKARELFFPNGMSSKGPLSEFIVKLVDFQLNDLDETLTIDEYFSITALTKLRFYLATKVVSISQSKKKKQDSGDLVIPEDGNSLPSGNNANNGSEETNVEGVPYQEFLSPDDFMIENVSSRGYLDRVPSPIVVSLEESSLENNNNQGIPSCSVDNFFLMNSHVSDSSSVPEESWSKYLCDTVVTKNAEDVVPQSITDILQSIKKNINLHKINQFNIFREDIFGCCVRAMRRKSFSEFNKISVKFSDTEGTSEGAIDEETLFTMLFLDNDPSPSLNDIDNDIKEQLIRLQEAEEYNEIQDVVLSSSVFAIAGYPYIRKQEEKLTILDGTLRFCAINRIQEPLNQFKLGLETCNVYHNVRTQSDMFKSAFCDTKINITARFLEEIFKIRYSEIGSNARNTENRIISYFRDYILDCEGEPSTINLEDILVFATGADCVPPLGFPVTPEITFLHDSPSRFPIANTCALQFQLPIIHKDYNIFKSDMDFGIGNCKHFGMA
ncbi:hypothetical protein RI129_004639 [Pyrocoelia pectoralis]|uniref:HECT domain-containing protein n=1 Tax=Pyrocoelia pectoralis TaxID=417401 RepID=A0AAN7ZGX3_9COLE